MAWYYDLVVLAILALCVWNGMRKGVSRSLLQTAATILSAVVALWVSQPLAELCYTEFLEKPVVSAVEGQLNTVPDWYKRHFLTMAFRFRENKYKACWQTQRELLPSMDSIPGG